MLNDAILQGQICFDWSWSAVETAINDAAALGFIWLSPSASGISLTIPQSYDEEYDQCL